MYIKLHISHTRTAYVQPRQSFYCSYTQSWDVDEDPGHPQVLLESCVYTFKGLLFAYSRGTKVEKMLTLAPKRYTAGFCMVAKVILWCI